MLGIARRTDERGYSRPLSESLRRRLTATWVIVATVAGALVWLRIAVGASLAWWGVVIDIVVSVVVGLVVGMAFGSKERDVAIPTWVAAGLAAFAVAALAPLIVWTLVVMIGMAVTHTGE